jgi:undecaprenyl-diphosphatase
LSRSGTTIATGILLRNKRAEVASFSFLMVVLPILGEALLDVKKIAGGELGTMDTSSLNITALVIGFIAAFIVGCIACRWMIDLVKKGKLIWFAVYCLIVGVVCLILQ